MTKHYTKETVLETAHGSDAINVALTGFEIKRANN